MSYPRHSDGSFIMTIKLYTVQCLHCKMLSVNYILKVFVVNRKYIFRSVYQSYPNRRDNATKTFISFNFIVFQFKFGQPCLYFYFLFFYLFQCHLFTSYDFSLLIGWNSPGLKMYLWYTEELKRRKNPVTDQTHYSTIVMAIKSYLKE